MRYSTIVADPPWPIKPLPAPARVSEGYAGKGKRREKLQSPILRKLEIGYQTMGLDAIAELPVRGFAARDAHLYLWTINRFIPEAYEIAQCWGFKPSTMLVWTKKPKGIIVGGFTCTTEYVLFCRRGSLPVQERQDTTWFQWPRSNTHSRKPDAFLDLVERVSPGPYLELFARRQRLGWDTWGDEALEHVELPA